jgi:predicted dithiol-disulfide oxidoreductase (DUF899 family)
LHRPRQPKKIPARFMAESTSLHTRNCRAAAPLEALGAFDHTRMDRNPAAGHECFSVKFGGKAAAMAHLSYPNESADYRAARNALLEQEMALRAQIEKVAAARRALPDGGEVPEDYVFEWIGQHDMPEAVKLSELFGAHDTLILYSFMYGPDRKLPCPGCTHMLDQLDGAARHIGQRVAMYIVAKSPVARLEAWAHERGWDHLSLISTAGNGYDADYFGDTSKLSKEMRKQHGVEDGKDWDETIFNVFRKKHGKIFHFWGGEMGFAPPEPGQHHRASDLVNPLWNLLDMTPDGRDGFFPKLTY